MNFWEKIAQSLRDDVDVEAIKADFEAFKTSQINDQIGGVLKNKEKILDEKKALQAELEQIKQQMANFEEAGITADKYAEMEVELESLRKNVANPDDMKEKESLFLDRGKNLKEKELRPEIERLSAELQSTQDSLQDYKARYQKYMAKNEVAGILKELNVEYDDLWFDGFMNKAQFEYIDSEDRMEVSLWLQEQKSVVPIDDWKKVFPNSTQGKKMIKAPKNIGGGAGGSNNPGGKVDPKDYYSGMFK